MSDSFVVNVSSFHHLISFLFCNWATGLVLILFFLLSTITSHIFWMMSIMLLSYFEYEWMDDGLAIRWDEETVNGIGISFFPFPFFPFIFNFVLIMTWIIFTQYINTYTHGKYFQREYRIGSAYLIEYLWRGKKLNGNNCLDLIVWFFGIITDQKGFICSPVFIKLLLLLLLSFV